MSYKKMSKAEKEEYRKQKAAKLKKFSAAVKDLTDSQRAEIVASHGMKNTEGHILSEKNTCLLYEQAQIMGVSIPTVLTGFKNWKEYDRKVSKGSKSFYIWIPCQKKQADIEENDESSEDKKTYFIARPVFDISQTESIV